MPGVGGYEAGNLRLIHTLSAFDVFGPEKTVLNECAGLNDAGWSTEIINFWHEAEIPIADKARERGIKYTCIVSNRKFDLAAILDLRRRISAAGLPLVHSHGYKADVYSLIGARLAKAPLVTTVHGWTSENLKVRLVYEKLQALSWRAFDRVFCVSESYRQAALRAGVSENKLVVVPNGIVASYNLVNAAGARIDARRELDIAEDEVVVAIVGRLGIEKGHELFLRGAAPVLARFSNARVLIIGEGAERNNICALVEKLQLGSKVRMLGHRDDLPRIYPAIDVLAITSLREGLPNVLLEAMLHSIPAVATSVGGIPDVIRSGFDGLMVPSQDVGSFSDALAQIVGNADLRRVMGERARSKILQEYLFEQRLENVRRIYIEMMHRRSYGNARAP